MEREDLKETLEDLRAIAREADEASRRIGEANARVGSRQGGPNESPGFTSRSPRDELYRTSGVHDPHARMMSYGIAAQLMVAKELGLANANQVTARTVKAMRSISNAARMPGLVGDERIMQEARHQFEIGESLKGVRPRTAAEMHDIASGLPPEYYNALMNRTPGGARYTAGPLGRLAMDARSAMTWGTRAAGRMQRMGLTGPSGSRQITYGTGSPMAALGKTAATGFALIHLANTAMNFVNQQQNIEFAYQANMQAIANERMGDHGMTRQSVWNNMIRKEQLAKSVAGWSNVTSVAKSVASTGLWATAGAISTAGGRSLIKSFFAHGAKAGPIGILATSLITLTLKSIDFLGGYEEQRAQQVDEEIKSNYLKIEKHMNNDRARAKQRSLHDAAIARKGKLWTVWQYVSNLGDESAAWSEEGMKIEKERWERAGPLVQQGEEFIANADITHARQRFEAAAKELDTVDFQPFMWKHPMEWFTTCEQARIASNNFARSQGSRAKPRSGD